MGSVTGFVLRFSTLLVLLIATLPFFFIGGPDWASSPLYRAVWDLGHFGFFALLLILIQMRWPLTRWRQWLWVAFWVFVVGGAIEIVQAYIGRDGTWRDAWNNLVGAALGLFWGQRANLRVWLGRCAALLALFPSAWSVFLVALVQFESAQQFPRLANFENQRELLRWSGDIERDTKHTSAGDYALRIRFSTAPYSGTSLRWFLGDWTHHDVLAFDLYNPGEPLDVTLRIHDQAHDRTGMAYSDRFNKRLHIEAGWSNIVIPIEEILNAPAKRKMDLHRLRAIGIFTTQLPREQMVYLDNLRLEKRSPDDET